MDCVRILVEARWSVRWVAAATVAALAGCAVGPRYVAPERSADVPQAYATVYPAVSAAAPLDRWWTALGDPLLDQLVDRALAGNPDLAAAEARVRQTRALAAASGAAFYPAATAVAQTSRDRLSLNGENLALIPFTPKTTQFTDYRVGFDASWELDLVGRTRREVEAAVARIGSAEESRNDARVVVAAEVASAYVDYREYSRRLDLARANLDALVDTLRLVTLSEHAGVASAAEIRRAEAEQLSAAAAVPVLESAAQSAVFRLAALTGEPSESIASRLQGAAPIPSVPAETGVGLPASVLERRPDVRRAERELAAATADIGVATAAQFPRLTLVGDLGWDSVRSGDLTKAASRYWNALPQLTLPLFAGGRLRAQVAASNAARDAALASYRATVLRAIADAESALVRYADARRREESLVAAAAASQQNLEFERQRFVAGEASKIDVLGAERLSLQASDALGANTADLARDYVALGKALGGGWQPLR